MKLAAIKLYLMVMVSGVILLAGLVLLIPQWGHRSAFSVYGANRQVNTLLLMLLSAVAGVVAWRLIKVLWHGMVGLHRLRCSGAHPSAGGSGTSA